MPARSKSSSGLSASRIDRAGRTLRTFQRTNTLDLREYGPALDVLRQFRREWVSDQRPLTGVYMGLKSMLATLGIDTEPVTRLKREPRIIDKLGRLSTTLSQMQDIGGVRIVVGDLATLGALRERICHVWSGQIDEVVDYVAAPRPDGYRSIHIIVRRHGHMVEVQLRTSRQQTWAIVVESHEALVRARIRDGEGDEQTRIELRALADALACLDTGLAVPRELWDLARRALDRLRTTV